MSEKEKFVPVKFKYLAAAKDLNSASLHKVCSASVTLSISPDMKNAYRFGANQIAWEKTEKAIGFIEWLRYRYYIPGTLHLAEETDEQTDK